MESEGQNREGCSSRCPFLPRLQTPSPHPIPAFLGLAFVLASLSLIQPLSLKPVSTAIKLADGVIKGTRFLRVLHSPSPESLILASKALIKGYKVSKRLNPWGFHHNIPSVVAAKLKACIGALNLLRYANSPFVADSFLGIGFIKGGYKVTKNSAKVLEGFVGLQLNSALRDGIGALGLLVKAAAVGVEITRWLSIEQCSRNQADCLFPIGYLRVGLRLSCRRLHFDGFHMRARAFSAKKFTLLEISEVDEIDLGLCVSELLCLSIPANKNRFGVLKVFYEDTNQFTIRY